MMYNKIKLYIKEGIVMNLTLHQMRVFTTVAEFNSVSKAAEKLYMTQPAVSNILKQLQELYDCQLIEIISRKLYLTEFGETLYHSFIDIQKAMHNTFDQVNMLKGTVSGTLQVATVSTAKYFMPKLLGLFREMYPTINIKLSVMNRKGIMHRLENNLDDFAVMSHPPEHMNTLNTALYEDELVVIASKKSIYHSKKKMSLSQLTDSPWLYRENGSGTLYATEQVFKRHKFKPKTIIEIGDNEAIKQSVIANFGVAVVSKASCELELTDKLLKSVAVNGFPVKHKWYVVRNKGKAISPLVEKFIDFMYTTKR